MSRDRLVAVFGSSTTAPESSQWVEAESVGRRLAGHGLGVLTGGYGGTMEAVSRGATLAGGRAIGVTAPSLFPGRPGANRHVTEEIAADSLTERIGTLTALASGVIALPGSIGTATELLIAWNLNHVARSSGGKTIPTVAVGESWRLLWEVMTGPIAARGSDVRVVESGAAAVDWLLDQPEIR